MEPLEPTYRESVCMGWALFWRIVGSFMLLMFALNGLLLFLIPELTRAGPPLWATVLPFIVVVLLCTVIVMPYMIRMLLRTSFNGIHLRLVREPGAKSSLSREV